MSIKNRRSLTCLGTFSFFVILGATGNTGASIQFVDVSEVSGLGSSTYSSPTRHSLGINWIDFDNDGLPDLFVVGGDPTRPPRLFHNQGDGTFDDAHQLLPTLPAAEMSGSRFADYDRDGDDDLFIYTDSTEWSLQNENEPDGFGDLLLRNLWAESGGVLPSDGPLFEEVGRAAGLEDLAVPPLGPLPGHRSKTASWVDLDRDGCIDLFVGRMVFNAAGQPSNRDRFWRNQCDGTFQQFADAGIHTGHEDPNTLRAALAAGAFHLNGDLWPDLYVVNVTHHESAPSFHDFLYINTGSGRAGGVQLIDATALSPGIANDAQGGMGIDVADIDLDGDWDVYISDIYQSTLDQLPLGNVLYLGDGSGGFEDNSAPLSGVEAASSWGVNFFDADRDGLEDLYVSSILGTDAEFLFRNLGVDSGGRVQFENVGPSAGFSTTDSRGSAVADYDLDGDLDLAVVNENGLLQLYRNETTEGGNWIGFKLSGTASNTDAIGAVVEVTTAGVTRRRQVKGGSSAHSQDDLRLHFGLGSTSSVDEVKVLWPSGQVDRLVDLEKNRYHSLTEGPFFRDGFENGSTGAWSQSS